MTYAKYFRVTIPAAVDTEAVGEGFIDDRTATGFAALPTTLANSTHKERANMRWAEIVKAVLETGAMDITDIDKTGGDEDTAPTVIAFTIAYESEKIVYMFDLVTDPTGATVYGPANSDLSGQHTVTTATELAVIERAVATALSQATFTDSREVYDPTANSNTNPFTTVQVTQFGTGGTHALRMASIESEGTFTVAQLTV